MPAAETPSKIKVFPVIGLEVHAQLQTRSKIFCGCPVTVGAPPNSATCPICLGFPGTLPVLNRQAVTLALRLAKAAGATIHPESQFARKNYFYPDLPKGYQITQYDRPFSTGGAITIDTPQGEKAIRLVRIHLEEDAGKLLHDTPYADVPTDVSLVDWNRAGVPLCEIVSEPDVRTAEEAAAYLTELRRLVRYTGVCDGDMEKGNLRCDANVSVRPSETAPFGTRVEIKNLNSIRFVAKAIEHEIERQAEALARGERIVQETRLWDEKAGRTVSMRGKEEAHDYRYFPEPDLGLLVVDEAWIAESVAGMPELPRARRARFVNDYGIAPQDAETLVSARELADYFERTLEHRGNPEARGQLGHGRGPALHEGAPDLRRGGLVVSDLAGAARGPPRARSSRGRSRPPRPRKFSRRCSTRPRTPPRSWRTRGSGRSATPGRSKRRSPRSWGPTPPRSRCTAPARPRPSAGSSVRS